MANTIKLNAKARVANGSGEARRARRAGAIPAALKRLTGENVTIQLNAHEFMMAMRNEISDKVLVELALEDNTSVHALLREVQRDVIDGSAIHTDFSEVDMAKKLRTTALIRLLGEAEGVTKQGGTLSQATHEIVIECLPIDLVDNFVIDISALKAGEAITVSDLKLGDKYTILTHADQTIVSIAAPEKAAEPAADAAPATKGKK